MGTFQTTVKAVSEAIEKNGLEHLRGSWFRFDIKDGKTLVVGGCVLAQAAINLGALQTEDSPEYQDRGTLLAALSFPPTGGRWTVPEDQEVDTVGGQIIYWNDLEREGDWALKTYADVAQMARECLEPYFDKEITLESYDWNAPVPV